MFKEIDDVVKGFIVPYDLPSENFRFLKAGDNDSIEEEAEKELMENYIRATRVKATHHLHSLGILATNSVILVPASKAEKIGQVVDKVLSLYEEVAVQLKEKGFPEVGEPVIRQIPILQNQIDNFKLLAERQLKAKLDRKISGLAKLVEKLQGGVEADKAKRIKYNLHRTSKELLSLEDVAKEFGIEVDIQFTVLKRMIDQALQDLEVKK